jgi:hypothetical protein
MFLANTALPVRKADNLTIICEPIAYTMCDPQCLTPLQASTACYEDSCVDHLCIKLSVLLF